MIEIIKREFIYLWYYTSIQFNQIAPYWVFGIILGSAISVFAKDNIHKLFYSFQNKKIGVLGLIPASMLGIASPLCMYGTLPVAASFSEKGIKDEWLAAFMVSSIMLNPQLLIYSMALGKTVFIIRFLSSLVCGIGAGFLVKYFYKDRNFLDFKNFKKPSNRDTDPNLIMRLLKNIGRNAKATGGYFLIGIFLTALFQRYVSADSFATLFGPQKGFGVLMAATIGVPLYVCGGGTVPLLLEWLHSGMSIGAAAAFMITGPATKITNLGALKIALGKTHFILYLTYIFLFSILTGVIINSFISI